MRALIRNTVTVGFLGLTASIPAALAQTSTAVVSTAGVTVEVDTEAWRGEPARFDKVLPVLVRITNDGEAPLRVRHTDFALVTGSGERVLATPPFDLRAKETVAADPPDAFYNGFYPYGYWPYPYSFYRFGPYGRITNFGYPYSPFGDFRRLETIQLPTSDMVAAALPESVVAPGDRATGFVYFVDDDEVVDLDHAGRVDFRVELVNAETRQPIDTIGIALLATSDKLEVAGRQES